MLKLLLVDDENTVLQGLTYVLSQYCPNYDIVGSTQYAADALRVLSESHVDAVITDVKMPDMDGIELTKLIRTYYPDTSVIVHSGYADFEFVRQSMKNGACDYLLKPCHYQNILDTLHKIEERTVKEGKDAQYQAKQELLKDVLSGRRALPESWNECCPMQMVSLMVVSCIERVEELLQEHWTSGGILKGMQDMVRNDGHIVMLFPSSSNEPMFLRMLYEAQQFLLKQGYGSYWGISERIFDRNELRHAYLDCLGRMEFAAFNELQIIISGESYRANIERQKNYSFCKYFCSQAIGKWLLKGDATKLKEAVEISMEALNRQGRNWDPRHLKNEVLKEMLHLEEHLAAHGVHPFHGEPIDYVDEVKKQATFRDLMMWVKHITSQMCEGEGETAVPGSIQAAIQYIELHYMDDISLKTLSDSVFLNPWYFSSQFKKYMKVTFSEFLNQVRVRMAKNFLKQKDLKVYQVAEMVGFQDAAYFSTVFKNLEQMSPKDFQKTVS
ncbi:response regulator [Paenibacillus frigoriresistens]|uniref:response regulator transcription factor n=1 Tax=Paenibacillus alginolyticus TaxID=59839 RepID=UPI001566ECB3|nr:response regulator [Paenibacillus frigoriresistens]NRF95863.1 response regulator [Paenibacillus frigoriresistens]